MVAMKYATAVKKLASMHPSEQEMHRQLHTLPSDKLRLYITNAPKVKSMLLARERNIERATAAIREIDRAMVVCQQILDSRVCVAS